MMDDEVPWSTEEDERSSSKEENGVYDMLGFVLFPFFFFSFPFPYFFLSPIG